MKGDQKSSLPLGGRARERGSRRGGLVWLSLLGIFLVACARKTENLQRMTLVSSAGRQVELLIEVADDNEERSRGLMFREKFPMGQGMLFVFDKPQILSFWMKNTKIPLDILFFDGGGKFVSTVTMKPCTEDPCQTYPSAAEAQYALEIPAGFVEQHNIGEGWYGDVENVGKH